MSCFDAITIPGLKEKFTAAVKEGMSQTEVRAIGTKIALDHLKDVNKRINDLRVATGLKKEKIVIDDKAKEIKEVSAEADKVSDKVKVSPDKKGDVSKGDSQVKTDKVDTKYYINKNAYKDDFTEVDGAKKIELDFDGDFFYVKGSFGYFDIYEGKSGLRIGGAKGLKNAIAEANDRISRNTKALKKNISEIIDSSIGASGLSPRYSTSTPSQISPKIVTESKGEVKEETKEEVKEVPHNNEAKLVFRKGFQNDMDMISGKVKLKDGTSMKPEGKRTKLDGMVKRLTKAKADGVIDETEFNEKYEMINKGYAKLPDSTPKAPKAAPEAKPTTPEVKPVPATGTKVDATDNTMSDYAKNNSWNAFKNKYPNVEKQAYYDMRDAAAQSALKTLDSMKRKAMDKMVSENESAKGDPKTYVDKIKTILKSLFPDIKVIVYNTEAEYMAKEKRPQGSAGVYNRDNRTIALNMELILKTNAFSTIFHEAIHPIVESVLESHPGAVDDAYSKLVELKDNPEMAAVWMHEDAYRDRGIEAVKIEAITEFLTRIADGTIDLKSLKKDLSTKIIEVVNYIFKKLGFNKKFSTIQDIAVLAENIKTAFDTMDVSVLSDVDGNVSVIGKPMDMILGMGNKDYNGLLNTIGQSLENGVLTNESVAAGVEYAKAALEGEGFTEKEIKKAILADLANNGLIPEAKKAGDDKKAIKENIIDSKFENSERITFRKLFAKINHAKRTTADAIQEIQAEVRKYFTANKIDLNGRRIVNLLKQLESLASMDDSVEALVDVIDSIDNIIAEQEHANDITEAKDTIKKFKKFRRKSKSLLAPYRAILDKVELVSPTLIAMTGGDLKQFTESLNTIMKEYGGAQGIRELTKDNLEYMANKMKIILADVAVYLEQKSVDKYNLLASKGKVDGMTYDEWMEDKQDKLNANKLNQKIVNSASKGNSMDKLLGLIRLQKERLMEHIKELNQRFLDDTNDSDFKFQKKLAQEFVDMDIDVLNEDGAREMNNIINNIINDGNYFNAGRFLSFWKDAHQVNKQNMSMPMRIRYAAAKKARSLATLFLSLTYNEKDAGRLRESLFSPVSEAATKAQRIMYGYGDKQGIIHDVYSILQKFGKDNHNIKRNKVGIFQFLNQAAASDPEVKVSTDPHALEARLNMPESEPGKSKEQDFKDRLQSIINGSVKGLYQLGMDNEDNGGATAKGLKDNALSTADALVQMGLIEGYTVGSKGIEVQEIDGVSLDKLYDTLDAAEKELYEYIKDKFADDEFLKAMKRTAESVHGMLWEGKENYAPQIAKRYNNDKDSAQKTIEDIGNGDFRGSGGKKVGVRPSDRFMQRGKLANPEEFYYSMDAVSNFITSYYESQLAINGARELKALSYVLNSGDFKDFMNGVYNKDIYGKSVKFDVLNNDTGRSQYSQLLERFSEILRDTANPPFLYKDTRGFAEKTLTWIMSGVTATYLQTSDQILKQLGPNIAAGMSISGTMATGIAIRELTNGFTSKENAEALNKFLSNFEGDFRSPMGEEILDEVNKMMNNPKGIYASMLGLTAIKDTYSPVRMSRAIMRKSDKAAYNINAIAAYINAEVEAGRLKSPSDFNIVDAAESPNRSSVAIALNQSEMLNNASKAAERAPYTRSKQNDPDINDRWIYNIMYLKGFSLNSFMNFANNLGIAVNRKGRATAEEQRAATLRAVSYGVQIGVFNVIKIAMLKTAYNAIGGILSSAVFGLDAPDETDEEIAKKQRARIAELGWQTLADAAIGWAPSPVEAGAKSGVNWIFDAVTEDVKGERKKLPYYLTQGSGTGSAQTLMDIPGAFMEGFKQRGGKSSPLTAEANAALDKMDWAKVAALSFGQGDLLKVMYGMEREIRESGKKTKSSSRSSRANEFNKAFGSGNFGGNEFKKGGF